jgi:hypothetical protein
MLHALKILLGDLADPSSMTVLGVVLGLSFGVSLAVTSVLTWLRPPRSALRTGASVRHVRRGLVTGPGPAARWSMASLTPALRHVFGRQSRDTITAPALAAGEDVGRLMSQAVVRGDAMRAATLLHRQAANRLDIADYELFALRRDLADRLPKPPVAVTYPAFVLKRDIKRVLRPMDVQAAAA